jgi:hypothetical protein
MTTSAVLIIPAAMKDATNAVGMALGYGPENYAIQLSTDGVNVTHYASRTDIGGEFKGLLRNPPPLPGLAEVLAAMIVEESDELWGNDHLQVAIAKHGMVQLDP